MEIKDELWDNLETLRRCIIEGNVKAGFEPGRAITPTRSAIEIVP